MLLGLGILAIGLGLAQAPPQAATEQVSSKAATEIRQGDAWMRRGDPTRALDAYKDADKQEQHRCIVCFMRMAAADRRLGDLGGAVSAAQKAVAAAQGNPAALAQAHILCGSLLSQAAGFGHPNSKKLPQAEAEYRAALAVNDTDQLHYDLAVVLLRQNRTDDGLLELRALQQKPDLDPRLAAKVQDLVARPSLAGEPIAPNFSLTTEDGTAVSTASLRGKVVLLDFWGSWCPPCRESVPMLRDLHKSLSNRSDFVMLGISSDTDAGAWRSFVAKNKMDWEEYLDAGEQPIIQLFGVEAFPTFVVLDRDGVIRFTQSGLEMMSDGSSPTKGELQSAIKQALNKKPTAN